jgi:hypothetical protein
LAAEEEKEFFFYSLGQKELGLCDGITFVVLRIKPVRHPFSLLLMIRLRRRLASCLETPSLGIFFPCGVYIFSSSKPPI